MGSRLSVLSRLFVLLNGCCAVALIEMPFMADDERLGSRGELSCRFAPKISVKS